MSRPKVSVVVEQLDEPIDIDRWVKRYVEIALKNEGVRVGGIGTDGGGSVAPIAPLPAARSR